jgi:hypothetical protein
MSTKYKRTVTPKREQLRWCSAKFCDLLERIDNRCMAADGPVPPTLSEATSDELRILYRLAKKISKLVTPEEG